MSHNQEESRQPSQIYYSSHCFHYKALAAEPVRFPAFVLLSKHLTCFSSRENIENVTRSAAKWIIKNNANVIL